jgi:hypothetical protein
METVNNSDNIEIKEKTYSSKNNDQLMGFSKNTIIVLLFMLVVLALLGFNLFLGVGIILDRLFKGFRNIVVRILTMFGFYTGAVINTTADIVGDTAKETIDIAEGSVQSLGHLLQNRNNIGGKSIEQEQWNINMFGLNPTPMSSDSDELDKAIIVKNKQLELLNNQIEMKEKRNLDRDINQRTVKVNTEVLETDEGESSTKWCPIGADVNGGKCMAVNNDDKCMFGKVFDDKNECENAVKGTFTGYKHNEQTVNWGVVPPNPPPASLPPIKSGMPNELPGMSMLQKPCGALGQAPCVPTTQNINGIRLPPFKQLPIQYPNVPQQMPQQQMPQQQMPQQQMPQQQMPQQQMPQQQMPPQQMPQQQMPQPNVPLNNEEDK